MPRDQDPGLEDYITAVQNVVDVIDVLLYPCRTSRVTEKSHCQEFSMFLTAVCTL